MDYLNNFLNSDCYVFGVILDRKGGAVPLENADNPAGPLWLHLDYSGDDCYKLLEQAGLPETAIESLLRTDTRPRSLSIGQGKILILRGVNMNPGASPDDMVSIRFWVEKDRLISLRQRRILSAQDIKKDLDLGQGPDSVENLLFGIIEKIADRVSDYVDSLEEAMEKQELIIDTANPNHIRREIIDIRRHAATVKRYLAPQREALESFLRQMRENLADMQASYLHEQADRIVRYVEDLDLVKEKAMLLQEELMNRMAQEQNSRMYVLSIIAAIFLPISFVTGLFGMNVAGLPGMENPLAFFLVAAFMLAVTSSMLMWLRHKRWL